MPVEPWRTGSCPARISTNVVGPVVPIRVSMPRALTSVSLPEPPTSVLGPPGVLISSAGRVRLGSIVTRLPALLVKKKTALPGVKVPTGWESIVSATWPPLLG